MKIDKNTQDSLHDFYLGMRSLVKSGIPRRGAQRSFEELVYSVIGKEAWRPTHITHQALKEYVEGTNKKIQRSHGSFEDRLERFDRTLELLEGPERSFEEWWDFFMYHDTTVLMTRREHGLGENPSASNMVKTPSFNLGYFQNAGFNARIRKRVEEVWMQQKYQEIFGEKDEHEQVG